MKTSRLFLAAAIGLAATTTAIADDGYAAPCPPAHPHGHHAYHGAHHEAYNYARAQYYPWHGSYYDPAWGTPYALVVPPTSRRQFNYGWGVGNTRLSPIYHQFGRAYPGPFVDSGYGFYPTPPWPSDTTQFGVYYVRGPW